jgi:hypothetical protein
MIGTAGGDRQELLDTGGADTDIPFVKSDGRVGRLDDAAGMLADLRVDGLAAMRPKPFVRTFLVR